ncbi:MAG: carboxypeptidase regulatory-like domain-containing protein, partial [Candidatus Desantisbacteria bacterium]
NIYYPGTVGTWVITGTYSDLVATATVYVFLSIKYSTITGIVSDILTKEQIKGATITLGTTFAITDTNGSYTLILTPATYTVSITHPDYYSLTGTIAPEDTVRDFSLCPKKRNIPQDAWTMFSMPALSNQIGVSAIGTLTPENLFEKKFKICRWDPEAEDMGGSQMRYREVETIEPNKGYWIKVYGEKATIPSGATPQETPVSIPLYSGWNMIGCPFTGFAEAKINEITQNLWTWTGKEYTLTSTLTPWQGYWIEAKTEATITLTKAQRHRGTKAQSLEEGLGWKIRLYAQSGEYKDNYNILGVAKEATLGIDRFDLSKPPAMEGLYCSFDGGLAKDIREEGQDSYIWNLNIQSQSIATLNWVIEGIPEDYEVWLIDGDKAIDMRKSSEFRVQSSELRIKAMKKGSGLVIEKLEITDLISYPNPSQGEVTFRTSLLTSGANLSAKLYNILGQVVKEQELTASTSKSWAKFNPNTQSYIYESLYSCLNNSNQKLANGLYFFQITAQEAGKQVSKIGKMVISR